MNMISREVTLPSSRGNANLRTLAPEDASSTLTLDSTCCSELQLVGGLSVAAVVFDQILADRVVKIQ